MSDMTIERLKTILEAYGADARRWPIAERDQATALLAASAPAQAMLAQQARLDGALDTLPVLTADQGLSGRIVTAGLAMTGAQPASDVTLGHARAASVPPRAPINAVLALLFGRHPGLSGLYAGACALGLLTGIFLPAAIGTGGETVSEQDIFELAFVSTEYMSAETATGLFE